MKNSIPSFLIHYASEYYDPVKAHEYYMKNRELTGRKKTLNDEGNAAKSYVKSQIDEERDNRLKSEDSSKTAQLEKAQDTKTMNLEQAQSERDSEIKNYTDQMNSKIESLRSKLEGMTEKQKSVNSARIQLEISKLRDENSMKKAELTAAYKSKSLTISNDYKQTTDSIRVNSQVNKENIRSEAKAKYESELDKIYNNSNFIKSTGGKSSKAKSTSISSVAKTNGQKTKNELARQASKAKTEASKKL